MPEQSLQESEEERGGPPVSRREALTTIGKTAVGASVIAASAVGLAWFYSRAPSPGQQVTQSSPQSSTTVEPGFTSLFDGVSLDGWRQAGPGGFNVVDGTVVSHGGMGLLWYTKKEFGDFILKVDWKVLNLTDNSGVFVRFPDPGFDPWNAVNNGYEVQIDDSGAPDGAMIHITGSIYSFAPATKLASNPVGEWNYYEIHAIGQSYKVILNGQEVTDFVGSRSTRGYVGLQDHNGTVTIRNVRIMEV